MDSFFGFPITIKRYSGPLIEMQYVSDSFAAALENVVLPVPAELWSNKPFRESIPG
jgi:hypothetical protein